MNFLAPIGIGVLAAFAFGTTSALAASFPERPVTIVVPYAPGGATDASARLLAQSFQKQSGGTFIVENVAGAGTTIGTAKVARAPADGYTLLWGGLTSNAMAPHLYPKLSYDGIASFSPISLIATQPYVLFVNAKSPFTKLADLMAKAKAEPGKINFASPGAGSSPHLTTELFLSAAQLSMQHVPYKGAAPAMTGLLAGDVDMMVDTPTAPLPMIKAGRLRPLAVTSKQRLPELPEVPTMQESGLAGFEAATWFGLFAPRSTPPDVIAALNRMATTALKEPAVLEQMKQASFTPAPSTPEQLADKTKSESAKWSQIIKEKNIRLE
ncbi:Bug family tripartite tricarboxylate transporter substrate binding protein [Noviherbaspirillum malthae]|uniref:Bug family tripartite tricarboxylate transporter substrate binding protein n=1 Tax=Noviherbaspirillum malthae TaxID=1260987 RepID=UPI00188EC628|nr:tripartite tricarboxylate transporter substrate binding protein [Noviherbaspirillum malthae]